MIPLPDIDSGNYLVQAWIDLGKVDLNPGVGIGPLKFTEIVAGFPWVDEDERRIIRKMSEEYISGIKIGENVLGIPPWSADK